MSRRRDKFLYPLTLVYTPSPLIPLPHAARGGEGGWYFCIALFHPVGDRF